MRQESVPARSSPGLANLQILQLIHSNESGGVEALSEMIGRGLQARGASVETHFMYPAFTSSQRTKITGIGKTITKLVRKRPDVLIAYQSTASVLTGVIGRLTGVKKRIVHQTAVPDAVHPLVRKLDAFVGQRGFYTVNVMNSHATAAAFASYSAPYRARCHIIEHGLSALEPRASRAATLARFKIPDDGPVLLNVGRLSDQKGQDVIIRALPNVGRVRLVVAGGGPNIDSYEEQARLAGVRDRVHFLGYISREDVGDLLGAADVFVFPSRWETFGLAPVEAAMTGMPVVAADLDVLREVLSVGGQSCTTFVKGEGAEDWAQALTQAAIAGHRTLTEAFSRKLRDKYSEDRMIDAYVSLLGSDLAEAAMRRRPEATV